MKVLLVDDNEDLTSAVKDLLDSMCIECNVKSEGKEGLNEILTEKGTYDLILLDIAMPHFSGYDVLDRLKTQGLLKTENIVIFTASSIPGRSTDDFLANGAKEVLKKPVSIDKLTQLIERYRS
jgi:CheY-like chemotaxis protein